ncbi:MAG: hypothetical protein IKS85_00930 [Lachnospiraceae bacterium]|nr:hypothetical protein [Lachnospiraceae bacterium]
MSKENQKKSAAEEKAEKVMTKYDLKMQKRKEEKEREERAQKISTVVGVLILLAILAIVASFPIRAYISLNKTYITVGDDKVTEVEFDYCYYTVVNNYVSQYSQYLSWFGLDLSKDLSTQAYSDTRSWQDFFEEMTVENMRKNKALKADAQAKGFTADVTAEYDRIVEQQKAAAKEAGMSLSKYLRQSFGQYATLSRIKPFIEEALFVSKYNEKLNKDMTPDAATVQSTYEADPKKYDSVDYRIKQFDAELPTEPTELADPVDESEEKDADAAYTPSEAEVEKAMADAKVLADAALSTIKTDGEEVVGILYDSANDAIRDWLFDDARKAGDTNVIEDKDSKKVYCVAFEKKYRDETPTVKARILVADTEEKANEIYAAWQNAGGTESAFEELCNGTYVEESVAEGGLLEGLSKDGDLYEELSDWLFADGRAVGDCSIVTIPDVASFVMFYVGQGQPKWYNTIESNLTSDAVTEYVKNLQEACQVSDPDKHLNYLVLEAQEKAAAEAEAAASAEGSEDASAEENAQ